MFCVTCFMLCITCIHVSNMLCVACNACYVVTRAGRGFCNTTAAFCDVSAPARPPATRPSVSGPATLTENTRVIRMLTSQVLFKYMNNEYNTLEHLEATASHLD